MDRDLWDQMRNAFATISMPLNAHQQVQAIMQQINQEAEKRAAEKARMKDANPVPVQHTE